MSESVSIPRLRPDPVPVASTRSRTGRSTPRACRNVAARVTHGRGGPSRVILSQPGSHDGLLVDVLVRCAGRPVRVVSVDVVPDGVGLLVYVNGVRFQRVTR